MDVAYIREYQKLEREHWWFLVRERILCQALDRELAGQNGLRILNIGAASGRSSQFLEQYGTVTSVEYEQEFFRFLRDELRLDVVCASIVELPFANDEFDLVCAFDVVEHVEKDALAAREMARVCRPGGRVMVTVPAFQELWGTHDDVNRHVRRYRSGQLGKLFRDGLQLRYASYFNSLLFAPIWTHRVLSRLLPQRTGDSAGSDFDALPPRLIGLNRILYAIFGLEVWLLRWLRFPFGVSIVHLYQKPSK